MSLSGLSSFNILTDSDKQRLQKAVEFTLPPAYNFEIVKTLRRIHQANAKRVCLQFPEGLLCWAESIALIIEEFAQSVDDVIIIGDVTYGACCIDDIKARSLKCDFLVHYAHSCLIPIDAVSLPCLYVFVEINFDVAQLVECLKAALPPAITDETQPADRTAVRRKIAFMGSIQFSNVIHDATQRLRLAWPTDELIIPQISPLTPGEVLGCTSPKLDEGVDMCIFIADGRFHLESAMIHNPHVRFYRFDPFLKKLYAEGYNVQQMRQNRQSAMIQARNASSICIVLSTLGRQGSVGLMEYTRGLIEDHRVFVVMISELMPTTLKDIASGAKDLAFVQIGCPRLSIDWGHEFSYSVLNSHEAYLTFGGDGALLDDYYAMDYFASEGGKWSNYGRPEHRDGSLKSNAGGAIDMKERLRQKWVEKKTAMQNCGRF